MNTQNNVQKIIFFDLDGTLVKTRINFKEIKQRLLGIVKEEWLGEHDDPLDVPLPRYVEAAKKNVPHLEKEVWRIIEEGELSGLDNATISPSTRVLLDTLNKYKQDIFPGILTNNSMAYTIKLLEKMNLRRFFNDKYLFARDNLPSLKPEKNIFSHIALKTNMPVTRFMYVGDHFIDALTALWSNVKFYWLNPSIKHWLKIRNEYLGKMSLVVPIGNISEILSFI